MEEGALFSLREEEVGAISRYRDRDPKNGSLKLRSISDRCAEMSSGADCRRCPRMTDPVLDGGGNRRNLHLPDEP